MESDPEESYMNSHGVGPSSEAGPSKTAAQGEGGMSKSAMKKAAKQAKLAALKPARREAEKERRRANRTALHEKARAGLLSPEEQLLLDTRAQNRRARKRASSKREDVVGEWKGGVVIDLGFDECMTEQEIVSMSTQLGHLYSANRTARRPIATVLHTSFSPDVSPRLWERMKKSSWERWSRSSWWGAGLDELVKAFSEDAEIPLSVSSSPPDPRKNEVKPTTAAQADGDLPNIVPEDSGEPYSVDPLMSKLSHPKLPPPLTSRHRLVYLSADSEEELTTLSEDEVYIIGGLVDRNRFKNICQDKAVKLGIRTARLPIGTYLQNLQTRKVLTVNQVFEILVRYIATESWQEAFEAVMPRRKFHDGKSHKPHHAGVEGVEASVANGVGIDAGRVGVGGGELGTPEAMDYALEGVDEEAALNA